MVKDGSITELRWDCIGEDGTGKKELSESGQYVMTEAGPLWYEQADALASVSIYAGGFLDAVKQCLIQGKGD